MNGILNFSIHFNVVHRKVDWRNPKMKCLNSMPGLVQNMILDSVDANKVAGDQITTYKVYHTVLHRDM